MGEVYYDKDWASLPSSRETAFTMEMMQHLDAEILIGQLSDKQRADIYNHIHEVENIQERLARSRHDNMVKLSSATPYDTTHYHKAIIMCM